MSSMAYSWILMLILSTSLLPLSTGEDSLTVGTSIRANQTIISAGGNFALGFFSPESSAYSYLGIWYNKIPKQSVIWVGNRDSPLPKNSLTTLTLSDNGKFVLTNQWKRVIWSTNVSAAGKNVNSIEGVLLDTGNLVIRSSDQSSILWQSFEHPTDTWMPTMKLVLNKKTGKQAQFISWTNDEDPRPGIFSLGQDPTARPQFYIWKRDDIYWRSNIYDASISLSTGYNKSIGFALYLTYIVEGDDTSISYSFSEDLGNLRITLVPSGQIVLLSWQQSSNTWTHVWRWPAEKCDSYGSCGPFSSCVQNGSLPVCQCLMGFEPTVQKDWINGNWASGCDRTKALACDGTDRFLKFETMKLPDHSFSIQNMSISECEFQCLRNCSCTAYAYANISEEHKVSCLNWFGPLIDLHNLATGRDLYVRLHGSELDSNVENGKLLQRTRILIAVAATAIFVGLIFVVVVCVLRMKRLRKQERTDGSMSEPHSMPNPSVRGQNDTELLSFSLRAVRAATDDFSVQNKLGRGGFGSVYKGHLPENQEVAVKRLSKKSSQGVEEFMNELKLIAKLQHTNLVRLLGCCVEGDEKILIYEYMPNRSLDTFLFEPSEQATLDWSKRFQIIEGIAQGFLYLHKYSRLKVIHRDLKASNILLDHDMTPKVSDFGMARIFGINQSEAKTNRVVGTYGYMSPEYAMYGQFSEKSDVFSFGVLLLEIVSGKRNTNFHRTEFSVTLLGWAWENWKDGRGSEFTDPSIRETCQPQEVEKCINIGLLCVQEIPTDRPTMSDVILMLGNENALLPSPKEPAFSTRKSFFMAIASSSQTSSNFSNNEVTLSTLHPR